MAARWLTDRGWALSDSVGANAIIATGCAQSGWDAVRPLLRHGGVDVAEEACDRWHQNWFETALAIGNMPPGTPYAPSAEFAEDTLAMLGGQSDQPRFLLDSRSLWLLNFWARQVPQARFLLFFTRPETALAYALRDGEDAAEFMDAWQQANRVLLQFQRLHRQRTLLLDAEEACRQPLALRDACRRIGLDLSVPDDATAPSELAPLLERLVARSWLRESVADVQQLEGELEASAWPLSPDPPGKSLVNANALIKHYRDRWLGERQLRERLAEAKSRLAQESNAKAELREQQERARHALADQRQAYAGLELALQEAGKEKEILLLQLNQVQAELEAATEERRAQEKAKQQDLDQLRRELDGQQQAYAMLEAKQRETIEENELLLLQLHQVQEELEKYFLKHQELVQAAEQDKANRQRLRKELDAARQQLEGQRQAEASLAASSQELQAENQRLLLQIEQLREELARGAAPARASVSSVTGPAPAQDVAKRRRWLGRSATGAAEPVLTRRQRRRLRRETALIKSTDLFDAAWYLDAYQDVARAGIDPVRHYLLYGAAEGRNPSPRFDTGFYLTANPDVAAQGDNPLVHFIRFGRAEGRSATAPRKEG